MVTFTFLLCPSQVQDQSSLTTVVHQPLRRLGARERTMAAAMPATPTMPTTTTTVPLPDYQVSGAGAAVPRQQQGVAASGSVGAFFGVLAAVLVLTVLSCVFGRVCAAHAEGPDEWYDCTRLVRRRPRRRGAPRTQVPAAEAKQPAEPQLPLPEP